MVRLDRGAWCAGTLVALLAARGMTASARPAPSTAAAPDPATASASAAASGSSGATSAATASGSAAETPRAAAPPTASYVLTARLDASAHVVHGEGTLSWVNMAQISVDELYFHLYLNAFENDQTLFNRSPFTRARSGRATRRWGKITLTRLFARELGVDLLPSLEAHSP